MLGERGLAWGLRPHGGAVDLHAHLAAGVEPATRAHRGAHRLDVRVAQPQPHGLSASAQDRSVHDLPLVRVHGSTADAIAAPPTRSAQRGTNGPRLR
ncbi:hypothetical protein GCM10025868_16470 [Angustibacter aerolatus]|uniref:Uncharacterized protein n=1 Tax=Angustibacter aerolatus TaxID=1162965 RepID=A0ABQ6JDY0_9ACTN|nr:hypothetical protein GCM10025868_16470 [Angustibacter aerolatus]